MAEEKAKKKMFICPHCEKAFNSISALNGHMGGCKARSDEPDEEEDTKDEQEDIQEEDEGITIFEDDEPENEPKPKPKDDDDDDGYGCGACGHTQKKSFKFCPKCGVENDFD